jgi:hypothetical protein
MRQIPSSLWSVARRKQTRWLRSQLTASRSTSTRTQTLAAMLQRSVYDLAVAAPHVPSDVRYTAGEFRLYRDGYDWALVMALRTMKAAEQRFELRERTRRLEARRRRKKD